MEEKIVFVLRADMDRDDIPHLCERVRLALRRNPGAAVELDVGAADPDAVTVEVLARIQLTARRCGRNLTYQHLSEELLDLIDLMGLRGVVALAES